MLAVESPVPRSRSRSDRRFDCQSETPEDRAARALAIVYQRILPDLRRETGSRRLGVARPSYDRAFVRGHEFAVQLARETGEWLERVVRELEEDALASGGTGEWRRIERRHWREAGAELAEYVGVVLPLPVREVVVLRSSGLKWRAVYAALPGRATFSVMDDWEAGLSRVWRERGDLVLRLT